MIRPTTKVPEGSEGTNRNLPARNMLVQLLALYTDPDSHNVQCYRQTDGRQTDRDVAPPFRSHKPRTLNLRSYLLTVSANSTYSRRSS